MKQEKKAISQAPKIKDRSIVLLLGSFVPEFYSRLHPTDVVFVLEGRPGFESSRWNCAQLLKHKIQPTVIADNTAGFLFYRNLVKTVWVAAQAVDREGVLADAGALALGVLAKRHKVAVYSFSGKTRGNFVGLPQDVCSLNGERVAPTGVKAYVPLVELLPGKYVRKIIRPDSAARSRPCLDGRPA